MTEFKITMGFPKEDYPELKKRVEKFFLGATMKIQREFLESCTTKELETLFLHQQEGDSSLSMIKRILTELYKMELSDQKKYLDTVEQFLMAHYSMVDTEGKLSKFKQDVLAKHFSKRTVIELADTYNSLLGHIQMDDKQSIVVNGMTEIILEKLDEATPISVLKKLLDADAENTKLENFIKEKFRLMRA